VVPKINYQAIAVDEADGPHAAPLWTCGHDHCTPVEAAACGQGWLQSLGIIENGDLPMSTGGLAATP
jgi:hypothetical protein